MDLTREYLLWRLGILKRPEIIALVDKEILSVENPPIDLIDISTSSSCDSYSFDLLLAPFVDRSSFTADRLLPIVVDAVRATPVNSASALIAALQWMIYDLKVSTPDAPLGALYYNLDHLVNDAIPDGYASNADVNSFIQNWLRNLAA